MRTQEGVERMRQTAHEAAERRQTLEVECMWVAEAERVHTQQEAEHTLRTQEAQRMREAERLRSFCWLSFSAYAYVVGRWPRFGGFVFARLCTSLVPALLGV